MHAGVKKALFLAHKRVRGLKRFAEQNATEAVTGKRS